MRKLYQSVFFEEWSSSYTVTRTLGTTVFREMETKEELVFRITLEFLELGDVI